MLSRDALTHALGQLRASHRRIVFTNGCFDLLHVGHARYLAQARALGDVLVVGVNSDESVQRLKGPLRPLVPERERAEMIAHLGCVDFVCIFDEDTPIELLRCARPAIHVKGGDYKADALPEAAMVRELGGRVHILPLTEGRSTTNVIQRIIETHLADS